MREEQKLIREYDEEIIYDDVKALQGGEAQEARQRWMTRGERVYRMRVYLEPPTDGETRAVMPTATDVVDDLTDAITAMPPVIGVRVASGNAEAKRRAQQEEEFLYGWAYMANFEMHSAMAVHNALKVGEGWLKLSYDDAWARGTSPLKLSTPDPKCVWAAHSATDDKPVKLVEVRKMTRLAAEAELGKLEGRPSDKRKLKEWLKKEIEVIEYWDERVIWCGPEMEKDEPEELKENLPYGGDSPDPLAGFADEPMPETEAGEEGEAHELLTGIAARKAGKVRKLVVVHAIMVNDAEHQRKAKAGEDGACGWYFSEEGKPKVYPGLDRIPYYICYGRQAMIDGTRQGVPILYSLLGGDAENVQGTLQARNTLMSLGLEIAEAMGGKTPYITDDEQLVSINLNKGALNQIQAGRMVKPLWPEQNVQMALGLYERLSSQVYESGIPQVLNGQVHNLSGTAVTSMSSKFNWKIGSMQTQHARQYEGLFTTVLSLTKFFADMDTGWSVAGKGKYGQNISVTVTADMIDPDDRVEVRSSNMLPANKYEHMAQLERAKAARGLTQLQYVDEVQKLLGNSDRSPQATLQEIIGETMFWNLFPELAKGAVQSPAAKVLAQGMVEKLSQYGAEMMPEAVARAKVKALVAEMQGPMMGVQAMDAPMDAPMNAPTEQMMQDQAGEAGEAMGQGRMVLDLLGGG